MRACKPDTFGEDVVFKENSFYIVHSRHGHVRTNSNPHVNVQTRLALELEKASLRTCRLFREETMSG